MAARISAFRTNRPMSVCLSVAERLPYACGNPQGSLEGPKAPPNCPGDYAAAMPPRNDEKLERDFV
jgi:hypothetical protein